jgi:DNA-binding NarL/FixJ family response regulator
MPTRTTPGTHLFVSAAGDVLDRWRRAFPSARGAAYGGAAKAVAAGRVQALWLHVPDDPFDAAQVLACALPVPVIVLADRPREQEALEAFTGGARGYCNTHAVPELLQQVASVVGAGGLWVGQPLASRLERATAFLASPRGRERLRAAKAPSVHEFTPHLTSGAPGEPSGLRG